MQTFENFQSFKTKQAEDELEELRHKIEQKKMQIKHLEASQPPLVEIEA